jgi:RNase P subunit RPR2
MDRKKLYCEECHKPTKKYSKIKRHYRSEGKWKHDVIKKLCRDCYKDYKSVIV